MEVQKFERKTEEVIAVQLTFDNATEVAAWCDGELIKAYEEGGRQFIMRMPWGVHVAVDDWILKGDESRIGYRTAYEMNRDYRPKREEIVIQYDNEQYGRFGHNGPSHPRNVPRLPGGRD